MSNAEAIENLRSIVNPGDTVYTVLRHVSQGGMMRVIDAYVIRENQPIWLSGQIADTGIFKRDNKRNGLRVSGVGMDMGFYIVYTLSQALFDDGYALKQRWL